MHTPAQAVKILVKMLKASSTIVPHISTLFNEILQCNKVPDEWNWSYVINLYKGKGDAMVVVSNRGLKLLEVVQKVLKRYNYILEVLIRSRISFDDMQFEFMSGCGTTDAIFILRQLQERHTGKRKDIFFAFIDLEKAFDRISR